MVTRKEVAQRAGVSTAVVTAAISGSQSIRMSPATRERVLSVVAELGYQANHAGRALATRRAGIIAAIVPQIGNPVFDAALHGVQDAAEAAGDILLLADATRTNPRSHLVDRLVGTNVVDGLILRSAQEDADILDAIKARGTPAVVLNSPVGQDHVHVWVDDREGIRTAVLHLLDLGHRRIAVVGGPGAPSAAHQDRLAGLRDAYSQRAVDPGLSSFHPVGYQSDDIHRTVTELMVSPEPPTGIVVDNATSAIAVLAAATDLKITIPDDLSVVGYHDVPIATLLRPSVTTVRMPVRDAGVRGYEALATMIAGRAAPPSTVVRHPPPTIVQRRSTARPH